MNDPLPDSTIPTNLPKYNNDVANYIDEYARREQAEVADGLTYAPKESELGTYASNLGAIWKSVYLDYEAGQEATAAAGFRGVRTFERASGRMSGVNALTRQTATPST